MTPLTLSKNIRPTNGVTVSHGEGAIFWDGHGRRYIDLSSQTMNVLFGQRHPRIREAVGSLLDRYTFFDQDFQNPLYEQAMTALASLLPSQLTTFNLRMNDGSSAVECAVKQARRYRARPRVLTVDGIYLGENAQTIHFRGWGQRPEDMLLGGSEDVVFAPMPYPDYDIPFCEAAAENGTAIAALIAAQHERLACVLVDPVMISCGVTTGRDMGTLLRTVDRACKTYSVPLIFDECQTFGWVPHHTLANYYGIDVDLLVLAKGVGGGLPLSVCASRPEFDNLCFGDADYTNGGTPAAIAGLICTCELLSSSAEAEHFERLMRELRTRLLQLETESRGRVRVRGVGLIWAIQVCIADEWEANCRMAKAAAAASLRRGLYVRTHGANLTLKPPRAISLEQLGEALDVIVDVVQTLN